MHMERKVYFWCLKMEILVQAATPALPEVGVKLQNLLQFAWRATHNYHKKTTQKKIVIFLNVLG